MLQSRTHLLISGLLISIGIGALLFVTLFRSTPSDAPLAPTAPEATSSAPALQPYQRYEVIGNSVEGRALESYSFGSGDTRLLFVGGMHGGYEWNTVLLAYAAIDYLAENPELLPPSVTVTIIPNLNPDGTALVTGMNGRFTEADIDPTTATEPGRFNARSVDLNRNFACRWQPESTWRGEAVSAGTAPFSEPEAATLRTVVSSTNPTAVVFWHSQGNAVYGAECGGGISSGTTALLTTYATAAGYQAIPLFDAYPITGDAEGWLATLGIPAITVELSTHTALDWEKNLAGLMAVITAYSSGKN